MILEKQFNERHGKYCYELALLMPTNDDSLEIYEHQPYNPLFLNPLNNIMKIYDSIKSLEDLLKLSEPNYNY